MLPGPTLSSLRGNGKYLLANGNGWKKGERKDADRYFPFCRETSKLPYIISFLRMLPVILYDAVLSTVAGKILLPH